MARGRKKDPQTAAELIAAAEKLEQDAADRKKKAAEFRKKAKDLETDNLLQYMKTHTGDSGKTLYEEMLEAANSGAADPAIQVSNDYAE